MKSIYTHPYFKKEWPVLVMAHRGGRGVAPENTMAAFQQAVDLAVDALELDIRSTADGELVVIHDATVDRTTDGHGPVHSYSLEELQRLDAAYWWSADGGQSYPFRGRGITIPTLEELFSAFPQMRMNIDIKQDDPPIVDLFSRLIVRYDMTDKVLVGSFQNQTTANFRAHLLEVPTAASLNETRLFYLLQRLQLDQLYWPGGEAFQIPERHGRLQLSASFITAAHQHHMEVHVWTVNERNDMKRLLDWGVDGLITDYPARLLALLQELDGGSPQPSI